MRICEMFRSLQGEGMTIGSLTYFIRTVGCNLSCTWCDTIYAMEGGESMSVDEIMDLIDSTRNVCITGGEPLLQEDVRELIDRLVEAGKLVTVETNGSLDVSLIPRSDKVIVSMDVKCPSSGMSDRNRPSNIGLLSEKDQLKFIIKDEVDLDFALRFLKGNPTSANVIFTPVDGLDIAFLAETVVSREMNVRVLPQLHKIIWGDRRSV